MTPRPTLRRRARRDDGALAVLTAVLAVVLFGIAALAVEFTDFYARDRASQTVADTAALSAAQMLPEACAAAERAIDVLVEDGNAVRNDSGNASYGRRANGTAIPRPQLRTQLSDRDVSNGEVQLLTSLDPSNPPTSASATWLDTGACGSTGGVTTARVVRVITPPRDIDLDFASAVTGNDEKGLARAVAAAEVRSPDFGDTLPVFLPVDCVFGPNYVITNPASPSSGGPKPAFKPAGEAAPAAPQIESVTASRLPGGLRRTLTIQVSNLTVAPTLTSVIFDLHAGRGAGTVRVPTTPGAGLPPSSILAVSAGSAPFTADFTLIVDAASVTDTAGQWHVRAKEPVNVAMAEGGWTNSNETEFFTVAAATVGGCADPVYGNFGTIKAVRDGNEKDLPENLVQGLPFSVSTFPRTLLLDTPCERDNTPMGALLSNKVALVPNCLEIDPGKSTGQIDQGLVDGVSGGGSEGRLATTTDPSVPDGCDEPRGGGDSFSGDHTWTHRGTKLWNTSLSCYTDGVGLVDLADPAKCDGCIDSSIVSDPRFFLVPVLNTNGRPEVSNQYPVKEFRAAFITDETETADARCASAVDCNGLRFNASGKGQLFSVQAFVFPVSALPEEVPVSGDGSAYSGVGPKDFLLVE